MSCKPYTDQTYEQRFTDFTNDLNRWQHLAEFQGDHGRMLLLEKIQNRANDMAPIIATESEPPDAPEPPSLEAPVQAMVEEAVGEALKETVQEMTEEAQAQTLDKPHTA